jgi:uncharacterized protein (TIGR02246 family)
MRPFACLCALTITACTLPDPHATPTGPDVDAAKAWLADYTAAMNAGDLEAVLALYGNDATSMPPDEPAVSGLDALRTWYAPILEHYSFDLTATVDEALVACDLAVLRSSYDSRITPKDGSESVTQHGSWLIVLREQDDGSWKLWRDMWSVIPPVELPEM